MISIVFDLDGTLIDSAPDIHAIANRVFGRAGKPELSLPTVRSFIGRGVPHLVKCVMEAHDIEMEEKAYADFIHEFEEDYVTAVGLTMPYPNVEETLKTFRDMGYKLGVCTNKPIAPTKTVLDAVNLTGYFDTILGGDSLPVRKPDAAPLHKAFENLGDRSRRLYVGDSEVDCQTATAAKVPFAIFTEGYRKTPIENLPHDFAFSDIASLPAFVENGLR